VEDFGDRHGDCAANGDCAADGEREGARDSVGRILGLDVGLRRIGVAISDEMGWTAQGLETLQRVNLRTDLAKLSELIRERGVSRVVVGLPLHMDGRESRQGAIVREFSQKLRERSGVAVELWDERLSTVEAGRVLRASGMSIEKRARAVDRLSAVLILQSYLDAAS
jgi:putative Holliday junction resolvase